MTAAKKDRVFEGVVMATLWGSLIAALAVMKAAGAPLQAILTFAIAYGFGFGVLTAQIHAAFDEIGISRTGKPAA